MKVPFASLPEQYRAIRTELENSWREILESGSFILGPQVEAFEVAFAEFCEAKHAVSIGSGTDALILALKALGVGSGDEVITAANSFVATAEAIVHAGATPVFVDIDPQTFNIDVARIEAAITPQTKAIIPVHLYGQPADMDPILEIAARKQLHVVEDAAQAHGARYKGARVGSLGAAGCFSFYPAKNLGAFGDGGAVVTNNPQFAATVRKLRDHGGISKYQHDLIGYTSRLDTLQAAVLLLKLKHLESWNRVRAEKARRYSRVLSAVPRLAVPRTIAAATHVFHLYVITVEQRYRDHLQRHLAQHGIQTLIHYPKPIISTPAFSRYNQPPSFPHAAAAAGRILSLPLYPELSDEAIDYVAETIEACMNQWVSRQPASGPTHAPPEPAEFS